MSNTKNKTPYDDQYQKLDYLGYRMDKDDVLDFLLAYRVIGIKKDKDYITVWIEADDREDLASEEVREYAKEKAEFKLNIPCIQVKESSVVLNGQNQLPYKSFTYRIH